MDRTRFEHISWCKQRAIEEMDYHKDPKHGIISMMSDLRKHPETNSQALINLCVYQLTIPKLDRQAVITFLNGFN